VGVEREAKPAWSAVPPEVRRAVEHALGTRVVRAVRAYGGYGPSATYVLTKDDGARCFFKGVYPLPEGSPVRWSLDREEMVLRRLRPYIDPWAPAYLGSVRADGWHGLLLEFVGGVRVVPWTRGKARRAAHSYASFHAQTLGRELPRWLSRTQHRLFSTYWTALAHDEGALRRLVALARPQADRAQVWLRNALPPLCKAEAILARAGRPNALLHFDTRSDNVRLQGGLLRMFDWPSASVGPAEFDVAAFAQSIESEGGPSVDDVVAWYDAVLPLRADVLLGSVAGLAGYFADRAPRPDVPELPRLRAVQRRQLVASLDWAARLLDLPRPTWVAGIPA
jgi:hypothetical protein